MRFVNAFACVACVLLAPLPSEAQAGNLLSQAEVSKINEVSQGFARAVLSADWSSVVALYVVDAVLYPPDEPAVKGPRGDPGMSGRTPRDEGLQAEEHEGGGSRRSGVRRGDVHDDVALPGAAEPVQDSGSYIEIRRRQPDGRG